MRKTTVQEENKESVRLFGEDGAEIGEIVKK